MQESSCSWPGRLWILRTEGFWGRVEASNHLYTVSCHDFAHTYVEVTLSCISCCWGVARPLAGVQDVAPQVGMAGLSACTKQCRAYGSIGGHLQGQIKLHLWELWAAGLHPHCQED